ncbi:MAG: hypothetical protein K0S53_160 [Bacteroidetes bacterium]|jgi:hypothetical protein|nr:hypothetical protein [Bacteroidota bacterium]
MKKTFLILAFISTSLFAQTLSYSFSDKFETIKDHRDKGFFKYGDNEYVEVYLEKDEKNMVFQLFDKSFTLIKTATASFPEFERHPHDQGFFSLKNDFYWFYSTLDRKTKTEYLFALPFDKNSLKFATKEIKLIETGRLSANPKYRFNYSTDSTKMLVTYRIKPKETRDKLNKDIIGFNLFDHQMNKLYAAEIEMPYSEFDMNNLGYEIDSRGNIYILTEVKINNSLDGEIDKENKNAMRYELIRVNQSNNTLQAIKIDLGNKYTNSAVLSEDLNRDIVIAGYYSDKKNSSGSTGAYIIRLEYDDKNVVKDLKTTFCEFPIETLKSYENARTKRKMEKKAKDGTLEASDLVLRKIIFSPDGSTTIIGEEFYVVTYSYYNGTSVTTKYIQHYNDILILKTDKTGKTVWCNKIPKEQISGGNNSISFGYTINSGVSDMSFHHHLYKEEDYFFYLDNAKNMNLPLTETPAEHSSGLGGYLTCVKIDHDGKMTKRSVFDIREEKTKLFPTSFESIDDKLIVDRLKADRNESRVFRLEFK